MNLLGTEMRGLASVRASMEGAEQRVFISHSAESRAVALRLGEYLQERGWESSIETHLTPTQSWQEAVAEAIEEASAVILLVGSEPSEALRFEWSLALRAGWAKEGKKVVPVLLLGADIPSFLRGVAAVRLTDDVDEEGFERIFHLIGSQAGDEPSRDVADGQARLSERLDQAVEALRRDSPNKEELREHRKELATSLEAAASSSKGVLCLSIGLIDVELGDLESARRHLESALREVEAEDPLIEDRLMTVLMPLGDVQAELGDYDAAVVSFERVRAIQSERKLGPAGEAATLQELGVALVQADRPEEAKAHLSKALEISRTEFGLRHPRVSVLELWLAIAAEACEDYEAAKRIYEESLASREEVDPGDLDTQVSKLLGLGHALDQLGDLEGSRQSFRRALDLTEREEVDVESLMTACVALGSVEKRRGNLAEARKMFERATEVHEAHAGPAHVLAFSQLMLGRTLFEMSDLQAAKKPLTEALLTGEEAGSSAAETVANALFMLGLVAKEEGDKAQAEKRFRQAIDHLSQSDPTDERRLGEFRRALDELLESSAPSA